MKNLDEKRREVQHAFEAALTWADSGERRPFFAFEKELWTLLLAAGRALTVLFLARQVARARAVQSRFEGRVFSMSNKHRTTELGTRFGKVLFTRPVARQVQITGRESTCRSSASWGYAAASAWVRLSASCGLPR